MLFRFASAKVRQLLRSRQTFREVFSKKIAEVLQTGQKRQAEVAERAVNSAFRVPKRRRRGGAEMGRFFEIRGRNVENGG